MLKRFSAMIKATGVSSKPHGNARDAQDRSLQQVQDRPLSQAFETVRTVEQCVDQLESLNFLSTGRLTAEDVMELERACTEMRTRGMALEPNLLSRAIVRCIPDPRSSGVLSVKLANFDTDWRELVSQADIARNDYAFSDAEYHYWRALDLYPAHHGILLQYAHTLKEQTKWEDALVHYIDTITAGGPRPAVEEHANFVAARLSINHEKNKIISELKRIPLSRDVRITSKILIDEEPSIPKLLELIILSESTSHLIRTIISDPKFAARNKLLMRYLAETREAQS